MLVLWYGICAKIGGLPRVNKPGVVESHQIPETRELRIFAFPFMFIEKLGPTGFDSKTNGDVSMPSAGIQLVNLIFHTFNWR